MSVEQWYDADDYTVPFANASNVKQSEVNAPFLENDAYFDFFNEQMTDFGSMATYQYENDIVTANNENFTYGQRTKNNSLWALFQQRSEGDSRQYNAYYAPSMLCSDSNNADQCDYATVSVQHAHADLHVSATPIFSFVNVSAVHALPISVNMLDNWILRKRVVNATGTPSIKFYAWPFAQTETEKSFSGAISGLLISFFMMIALIVECIS